MKNKKFTQAILLVFVLGVWGTIFYKIYDKLHDEDDPSLTYEGILPAQSAASQADTFQLLENYNDPFLNKVKPSGGGGHSDHAPATNHETVKPVIKTNVNPVQVKYLGLIKNKAGKKSVAIVSVNNKSSLLQEGESSENVKLLKLTNDSILVQVGKQKVYVRRN